ncbi:bifunctional 3'-5' exonuclease/DNA polymerase [Longispora albida]|uniref:bifunctional 3'-5' exonuclease/DNA polymerase n=1 Tax=Longispora albida TaxID=203523 RepID=UPI000364E7EF
MQRIAVVEEPKGGYRLRAVDGGAEERLSGPAGFARPGVRWVWADTPAIYPKLLAAGVRVDACHDVALTEALLSGHAGRWGEPRALPAAWARLTGAPVPPDPPYRERDAQPALFEPVELDGGLPAGVDPLDALVAVHEAQQASMPDRAFRLLAAVESAGALAAAELGHAGLPWRADVHDALLVELLGERAAPGLPPRRLTELAGEVVAALGGQHFHVDSPAELIKAFARAGIRLPSTRKWVLEEIDHPAVRPLLEYKELYRLYVAHGWSWLDTWVSDGRFRPEYVAGGVVSGRWASRGGAALQIPKVVRRAVIADEGHVLICADAGQLEPRILAAMAGDRRLAEAARDVDLYAGLAAEAFGGDRQRAKIGMLAAMYGQTGGEAAAPLATLRKRFPVALEVVEQAARAGEEGRLVRSLLGRTCPAPSATWWGKLAGGAESGFAAEAGTSGGDGPGPMWTDNDGAEGGGSRGRAARARGRFTRNFVVQATAAEWALAMVAGLRRELREIPGADLVFFQHDEVIVHCPAEVAEAASAAVERSAEQAGRLLFGETAVRFPVGVKAVNCYGDAK